MTAPTPSNPSPADGTGPLGLGPFADSPTPLLSANIYCSGKLDELIYRAIVPFWRAVRQQDPERQCRLWMMRYSRCGEHLKVRLHGPEEWSPVLEKLLAESVNSYFSDLGPSSPDHEQKSRSDAPPIDVEDQASTNYEDRTLLWTEYGRSHVALGGRPFLDEDRFVGLVSNCLSEISEEVLAVIETDENGVFPYGRRQLALYETVIAGVAALAPEQRAAYLSYHRNWMLRMLVVKNEQGLEKARGILARFEKQVAAMANSAQSLRGLAEQAWNGGGDAGPEDQLQAGWRRALAALVAYVTPLCEDPDYHVDPFASDPVFAPLIKTFQGASNQLGFDLLNESFTYHVLLRIAADRKDDPEEFRLTPL